MTDYIKREDAILAITRNHDEVLSVADAIEDLESVPSADVRPVVRARWQYKTITVPGGKGQTYARWCCTACKGKAKKRTNFCSNCGAEMKEE